MPLGTLERLPRAARIWEEVYQQGISEQGYTDAQAAATAWTAVKRAGYEKDPKTGDWRRKKRRRASRVRTAQLYRPRDTFSELAGGRKNVYLDLSPAVLRAQPAVAKNLFKLIDGAYAHLGGHLKFRKVGDLTGDETLVVTAADIDADPLADVVSTAKRKPRGIKSTGLGHDGSDQAKREIVKHKGKMLNQPGYYGELSDKIAHIMITRFRPPAVTDPQEVCELLGKQIEWVGAHPQGKYPDYPYWYFRTIAGKRKLKILLGRPLPKTGARGAKCHELERTTKTMKQPERSVCRMYKLDVLDADRDSARRVRGLIEKGIERAADYCKMKPSVCKGNLGLSRAEMPQILDTTADKLLKDKDPDKQALGRAILDAGGKRNVAPLKAWMDYLKRSGVKIKVKEIPVGMLKATQREIQARKAVSMADSHLCGKFPKIDAAVLGSADGHILDGHHRWAALAIIGPERTMKVKVIELPIRELLNEAAAFPGIFQADFMGRPVSLEKQRAYKAAHRSKLTPKRRAKAAKNKPSSNKQRAATRAAIRALAGG